MAWPQSQDYNEAIQTPQSSFADPELRGGQAVTNALGLPMPRSGNFADVYEFLGASGVKWAIKCFTREVPGLQERYSVINKYLAQANLPYTVHFDYLGRGIRIRGDCYPVLKMQWIEGYLLNEFVRDNLDKPAKLESLARVWVRMARSLRKHGIAHADLQHGNVILVPGRKAGSLALKLIDYDGMFLPSLALKNSGEVGHPNFQHPQRLQQGIYNAEVDRLPQVLIACALQGLVAGGKGLWDKFDNGDNLLFREADLRAPGQSALFKVLWNLPHAGAHDLVGHLVLGLSGPLEQVPALENVMREDAINPLTPGQEQQVVDILGPGAKLHRAASPPGSSQHVPSSTTTPDSSTSWESLTDDESASVRRRRKTASNQKVLLIVGVVLGLVLVAVAGPLLMRRDKDGPKRDAKVVHNEPGKKTKGGKTKAKETEQTALLIPPDATSPSPVKVAQAESPAPELQAPRPAMEQARIDAAIEKGVKYLKTHQTLNGTWATGETYAVGYAALAGLTLLECGVSPKDPVVAKAAGFVRNQHFKLTSTYESSLSILFFDRLRAGDLFPIHVMATRLVAAQSSAGGWHYTVPLLPPEDLTRLRVFLEKTRPKSPLGAAWAGESLPTNLRTIPAVANQGKPKDTATLGAGQDDNSNSQFAMFALWTARRHGIFTELPLLLAYQRYRVSQNVYGGWGYSAALPSETPAMTCVGLLGLAMGHGSVPDANAGGKTASEDPAIQKGLKALGSHLGALPPATVRPPMANLYFLWALERVAMVYNLKTIGGKDWYDWGAHILVPNQLDDGSWRSNHYAGASSTIDTCLALLFLKRSNLVQDLTDNLRRTVIVSDPDAGKK